MTTTTPGAERAERDKLHSRMHRSLTNQTPIGEDIIKEFEDLRTVAKDLSDQIIERCPLGREQSLTLTHLEETVMWAIKSIALNQWDVRDRLKEDA